MKIKDLFESNIHKEYPEGSLTYRWRADLPPRYIPSGYTNVLELGGIFANTQGEGQGDTLMKIFLSSPEAKQAELIFLDPVPNLGSNYDSSDSETMQIRRLQAFYRRYGFRNNPKATRMWLVQKGSIPTDKLPS